MFSTHLQFLHLDLNWIVYQEDLTKYLFSLKEQVPSMDNALRFVVFDMDSCQLQWKQFQVMNFLFDLIHFHSSIPFLGIGYPFHLLTGGDGNALLIMSSLFVLISSPLTTVNERSFASIVDLESKLSQIRNSLLVTHFPHRLSK